MEYTEQGQDKQVVFSVNTESGDVTPENSLAQEVMKTLAAECSAIGVSTPTPAPVATSAGPAAASTATPVSDASVAAAVLGYKACPADQDTIQSEAMRILDAPSSGYNWKGTRVISTTGRYGRFGIEYTFEGDGEGEGEGDEAVFDLDFKTGRITGEDDVSKRVIDALLTDC